MNLLLIRNLQTHIYSLRGVVKAVDGVSFSLNQGETLGVVGETGCGKSMTALSILRLLPRRARIVGGEILFQGENIVTKSELEMKSIRGRNIAMIFQDPNTSLNPLFRVGDQVAEALLVHARIPKRDVEAKVIDAFKSVGIPDPEKRLKSYPHELSGGMKQRIMIAMGLLHNPKLLIADEPTTALDTTIQAQILELMKELKTKFNMATLLITHNIGIVAETCDNIAVMYAGEIVEYGDVVSVFNNPKHPYTSCLLQAFPSREKVFCPIAGSVPDAIEPPSGCKFHPRCNFAKEICKKRKPNLVELENTGHLVCCHLNGDGE
ncbi:peptide ABC transporter ATP-binding protein [Candidatus Bathyarchaeota archaeon RBG_13_46_16b]|nr:MAG: peptide ABC transporter ATP-binding protein [Candidatus Bathyarchaeota archaeon RBG_13_46_16b]